MVRLPPAGEGWSRSSQRPFGARCRAVSDKPWPGYTKGRGFAAPALLLRCRTKLRVVPGVRGDRGPFGYELLIGQPLLGAEDPARPEPEGPDLFVDVGCRSIRGGLKSGGHAVKHMPT